VSKPRFYLDHAATTPIHPAAKAAMIDAMERWANPSSPHGEGRSARAALEDARARIKKALGWHGHAIFTSGASEAIDIALKRAKGGPRFISAVEHDAVFRAAPEATVLPMGAGFQVDLDMATDLFEDAVAPIVAIQDINPETGKGQPLDDIARVVRGRNGLVIADCAQSAGKHPLPEADMVVVSAHKLGGPPGAGALLVRDLAMLGASGGQEQGYRGGTENLPAIMGFAAALERGTEPDEESGLWEAMDLLVGSLLDEGAEQVGVAGRMSRHIVALAMPRLSARAQLVQFDLRGIAVSAGSACSSGSLKPSRVLSAFGIPDDVAERTIRLSVGWSTTPAELEAFRNAWCEIARDARNRAA
jgi:cysteine desulfurase